MKKNSLGSLFKSLLGGLGLVLITFSCSKVEDLLNVPIYVDTDVLHNALTVQFINADGEWNNRPSKITVEIKGKDRDKLFSMVGEREINVPDNHLKIGIKKSDLPTPQNPLEFTVIAKAPGFLPSVKNYSLTSSTPTFTFSYMVAEQAPPSEIGFERNLVLANGADGLKEDQFFSSSLPGKSARSVDFIFDEGTKFYAADGSMVNNSAIRMSMLNGDNSSDVAINLFPGGIFGRNQDDQTETGAINFSPAVYGCFSLKGGSTGNVKTLSKPAKVRINLDESFINPQTKETIKQGDQIEFWGMDVSSGEWKMITANTIAFTTGAPVVEFSVSEIPDFWTVAFSSPASGGVELYIHSNITPADPDFYYYVVIRQLPDDVNCCEKIIFEGYQRLLNGDTYFFTNLSTKGIGVFEVYTAKYECNEKKLVEKVLFFWEQVETQFWRDFSKVNIFLSPDRVQSDDRFRICVDVFGVCSNGDTVLRGVPSLDLQYSSGVLCEHGEWELLGRLQSGLGCTGALKPGEIYNFYFEQGDVFKCLLEFPITMRDTVYRIESPVYDYYESVFVDFDSLNNQINFQWHNVLVPEKACEEYRQYY